ncbi:metallophosphoesterase family protein [Thermofilum pendens]|uniref:Calcineurin-like phosphoesterase domain-containing protein n=1 Tax=Thermofilum pendens (strain DSM 2475 / Hrk 5) TaxID=368408 RepID=A1RWF7_THEPD|nr:metallophosphoesterase family protein [Thermofilum pendens]ABL77537.1 hypothetical protein Tpen_0127 [Thermofilum pendens Hrk 5]
MRVSCEKALFASDTHCRRGRKCRALEILASIAEREGAECLFVAGDLFDNFHFKASRRLLIEEFSKIIDVERLPAVFAASLSSSSHDPLLDSPLEEIIDGKRLLFSNGAVEVQVGGRQFIVIHGDRLVGSGVLAFLLNFVAERLGRKLYLEEAHRRVLGLGDEWLVMGHTHIPGIDREKRLVNLGSWKTSWKGGLPYWRKAKPTVLLVDDNGLRLEEVSIT